MALPLDPTGSAISNKIVNEIHNVTLLKDRHFVPMFGTFYVRRLKIYDLATGRLLEPVLQYNVLQQNTEAANEVRGEVAQIIYISDHAIKRVAIEYQAVGGKYENVAPGLQNELELFRTSKISSVMAGVIADEFITLPPREYLGQLHEQDQGSTLYKQLSNIAETIVAGDPSGQQMSYEYMLNYTYKTRDGLAEKFNNLRTSLDVIDVTTRIVDKQYIFTREELNPYIYLNYGTWVKNSNMLFRSGPEANPQFGAMTEVQRGFGLLAVHAMAYQRDDSAEPTRYTITPDKSTVNEGESITFTLSVPDVPAGTSLAYILQGVEAYDIVGGQLTGNFVVAANGISTVTIGITADGVTDGEKTLIILLRSSPDVYSSVKINDTSKTVVYQLWYSTDEVGANRVDTTNEGESVFMQIRTNEADSIVDVGIDYTNSTVTDADFEQPLPTLVSVVNGSHTVRLDVKADFASEGNESLIAGIYPSTDPGNVAARAALMILDTSRLPVWNAAFYPNAASTTPITQVNEGDSFVYKVTASNISAPLAFNMAYSGTADQSDFTNTLPTQGTIQTTATFVYNVKADQLTEQDELFTITSTFADPKITTAPLVNSITIKDTSVGYGVQDLYLSDTSAGTNKLTAVTVPVVTYTIIKTNGFANGEMVYVDYSASDPKLISMLGYTGRTTVVSNGHAYIANTFNDPNGTITGITPLRVSVYRAENNQAVGNVLRTLSATVNPRLAPSATLTFSNMADFNPISSIAEGSKFRLRISTVNIPNGSPALTLTYGGTASADDFVGVRPSSVVVTDNVAIVEYTVMADRIAEGNETCTITVGLPWSGGSTAGTITILDTSLPLVELTFTSDLAGNTVISSVNEGSVAYMRARSVGYPDGTVLDMVYSGTVSDNDISGGRPATMTIVGNTAVATLGFINDETQEGAEQLIVQAKVGADFVTASPVSLTVNDTSIPGPVRIFWSESTDPYADTGNLIFNESSKKMPYLHIETKNLPYGTMMDLTYSGTANAADFDNGLPATVSTTGQWTRLNYPIKSDNLPEPGANEFLNAGVKYLTREATTPVAIVIEDTSFETELEYRGSSDSIFTDELYVGLLYKIRWGGDLWDYFVSVKGREPLPNESVRFTIPQGSCVLSGHSDASTIVVSSKWNNVGGISITNRGLLLGYGGKGASREADTGLDGRMAIINNSVKNLIVSNYNVIAGGGGGGAAGYRSSVIFWNGGGGGAPFGYGGGSGTYAGYFTTGGRGGQADAGDGNAGGNGGDWGMPGIRPRTGRKAPGSAGVPFAGTVTATNINGGKILGRGWTS